MGLPSPLVPPLADNRRLAEIIAAVLDKPVTWAWGQLLEQENLLGAGYLESVLRWGVEPHEWSPRLVDYYRETELGAVGNPVWNRRPEKLAMREWIGQYLAGEALDVVTIGDGSGFDSLYLALCGHRVTCTEGSRHCRAFAERIFADAGASVRALPGAEGLGEGTYDVVVCLDVLEHVPGPPALVADFVRLLRPGGRLIVHAPFFFVTRDNPTHLRANRKYSGSLGLYTGQGLRLLDGRFFWAPLVLEKPPGTGRGRAPSPRAWLIRLSGLLLKVGRWWNWPHNLVARRAMQTGAPRWRQELLAGPGRAPEAPEGPG